MKIPLSLSVYEHAARLIDRTPWDVSRDPELLYAAQSAAYRLYRHFPVVVGIDIYNLEAEAYGCTVHRTDGAGVPSVTVPLLTALEDGLTLTLFDPARDGRIPMVVAVARRLKADFPEADIRVPVAGPFSIAQCLLGLEQLVISAITDPQILGRVLMRLVDGQLRLAQAVKDAGVEVAFFESAAAPPLLSPDSFRDVELPALKRVMHGVAEILGHPVPCIIGGNTLDIIPYMLETGTNFLICPAEADRRAFLKAMEAHPQVKVRVNMPAEVTIHGPKARIAATVDEIVSLAAGRPNVLLGTGAIAYETPPEHILFLKEYCGA